MADADFPTGRVYIDQDGSLHHNGAAVYDANEVDISAKLNQIGAGALTLTGVQTLGSVLLTDIATLASAGADQANAAAIANAVTIVTGADGAKGVKLPTAAAGVQRIVYNSAAGALLVYPNSSDDINDGTVNTAIEIEGKSRADFIAVDDTTWAAAYVVNA